MDISPYLKFKKTLILLSNLHPLTLSGKQLDKKTDQFLAYLFASSEFQQLFNNFRKINHIPSKGMDINTYLGKDIEKTELFENDFIKMMVYALPKQFFDKYGESNDILLQIILLGYFNACVHTSYFEQFLSDSFEFVVSKKDIAGRMTELDSQETTAILIPFNTSKSKLKQWIDRNWDNMQIRLVNKLELAHPVMKLRKNFELAIQIIKMRDENKMSFIKIRDYFMEQPEYAGDNRVCDDDHLEKIYKQYKPQIAEYSKFIPKQAIFKGIKK